MKTKHFLTSLVLLVILPCFTLLAETVGTLELRKGIIKVRRNLIDKIYREEETKIAVANGDQIQTGYNTRVIIHYHDNRGETELYSKTFFTIEDVGKETDRFFMPVGKMRFKIPAIKAIKKARKNRLRLRTVNAVIGVKGSEGVVGSDQGETILLTLSGDIVIASVAEPEVEIQVPENQASKVIKDAPPLAPIDVPESLREKVIESDTSLEFEEIQFEEEEPQKEEPKREEEEESSPEELISDVVEEIEEIEEELEEEIAGDQSKEIDFTIVNP